MSIDLSQIRNPIIDREPAIFSRDPAIIYHDGVFQLYHSAGTRHFLKYTFYLEVSESRDLVNWSPPRRVIDSKAGYSSPGNAIEVDNKWVLCVQTYPIPRFKKYASEKARLWLVETDDLDSFRWGKPIPVKPEGTTVNWTRSHRQIDPYLVEFDDKYWCLYKTSGALSLLVSRDLRNWQEATPNRPILSRKDLPIRAGIENPCVIQHQNRFMMFFAPTRRGRGIGVAISDDLIQWEDVHILDFPTLSWAPGGPTAPFVLDLRGETGHWLMAFHGDTAGPHGAALGLAWSKDLENWHTNEDREARER